MNTTLYSSCLWPNERHVATAVILHIRVAFTGCYTALCSGARRALASESPPFEGGVTRGGRGGRENCCWREPVGWKPLGLQHNEK